jgi:hypothetical protein
LKNKLYSNKASFEEVEDGHKTDFPVQAGNHEVATIAYIKTLTDFILANKMLLQTDWIFSLKLFTNLG